MNKYFWSCSHVTPAKIVNGIRITTITTAAIVRLRSFCFSKVKSTGGCDLAPNAIISSTTGTATKTRFAQSGKAWASGVRFSAMPAASSSKPAPPSSFFQKGSGFFSGLTGISMGSSRSGASSGGSGFCPVQAKITSSAVTACGISSLAMREAAVT